ncbi:response regulator [Luteitalea sp. TBR-22]|uniref:response regulator transcription factor n=1 Tax=Luteitalea sp. TBR-22 TaxID=2802971 RepID=UPI001AF7F5CD|nr:response regulator [Luteitalea sp. TBR-22]BCS32647.1 response regulator [Luteitalea sp. TBR-22]
MTQPALVAVVDDDVSVRESLPDLLADAGWRVEAFASAEAFLDARAQARTHCLILDIGLPGLSGPELHEELLRRGSVVPTVFISARLDDRIGPRLMAAGAVAVLAKPFSVAALVDAVAAALRTR